MIQPREEGRQLRRHYQGIGLKPDDSADDNIGPNLTLARRHALTRVSGHCDFMYFFLFIPIRVNEKKMTCVQLKKHACVTACQSSPPVRVATGNYLTQLNASTFPMSGPPWGRCSRDEAGLEYRFRATTRFPGKRVSCRTRFLHARDMASGQEEPTAQTDKTLRRMQDGPCCVSRSGQENPVQTRSAWLSPLLRA